MYFTFTYNNFKMILNSVFLFLLLSGCAYTEVLPRSIFCAKNNVTKYDKDGNVMTMNYSPVNSPDCSRLSFEKTSTCSTPSGDINVKAYLYKKKDILRQTGLNLTVVGGEWLRMKFRIKDKKSSNIFCREFERSSQLPLSNFFFDCLWSDEGYEGKSFEMEYEDESSCGQRVKNFHFKIPSADRIDEERILAENWELFLFAETRDVGFWPNTSIVLRWDPMPTKFGVECYEVVVNTMADNWVPRLIIGPSITTSVVCGCSGYCEFQQNNWLSPTWFGVRPMLPNGSGFLATTDVFTMRLIFIFRIMSVICWSVIAVGALGLIPLIIFGLRKILVRKKSSKYRSSVKPQVLILYSPTTSKHLQFVQSFVRYLRNYCDVAALFDEFDIPLTESKDPFTWCNQAVLNADHILLIASPFQDLNLRTSDAIYHTDKLLLQLIRQLIAKRTSVYFSALIPEYATKADLPLEAANFRVFKFPEHIDNLLGFFHSQFPKLRQLFGKPLNGGSQDFQIFGKEVIHYLKGAKDDLVENSSHYRLENKESAPLLQKPADQIFQSDLLPGKKTLFSDMAFVNFRQYPGDIESLDLLNDESKDIVEANQPNQLSTKDKFQLEHLNL